MSAFLEELESTIAGLHTETARTNVGVVREVGDGVTKIEGLSEVMLNEMIEFPEARRPMPRSSSADSCWDSKSVTNQICTAMD
jgi:F0F1-type ATP synthase alpha subunit